MDVRAMRPNDNQTSRSEAFAGHKAEQGMIWRGSLGRLLAQMSY